MTFRSWSNSYIRKKAAAQVFSSEFCEIFKNTYYTEHLPTTASELIFQLRKSSSA